MKVFKRHLFPNYSLGQIMVRKTYNNITGLDLNPS